jgi:hypothetical protein
VTAVCNECFHLLGQAIPRMFSLDGRLVDASVNIMFGNVHETVESDHHNSLRR